MVNFKEDIMEKDKFYVAVGVSKELNNAIKIAAKKSGAMSVPAWCRSVIVRSLTQSGDYKVDKK